MRKVIKLDGEYESHRFLFAKQEVEVLAPTSKSASYSSWACFNRPPFHDAKIAV